MFREIIETERLILRPFRIDDVKPSFEMEQNPNINRFTNDGGIKTYEDVEKLIRKVINVDYQEYGFGRFALELKETSEFIGFSGLKYLKDTNEIDLGYRIRQEYWGKGLATESGKASIKFGFEKLKLNRIIAFILPGNVASKNVLTKLRFSFEKEMIEEEILLHKYFLNK